MTLGQTRSIKVAPGTLGGCEAESSAREGSGKAPGCLLVSGEKRGWKQGDRGYTPHPSGTVVTPAPDPHASRSSPARLQTHLLQQGKSHPGWVFTVSNDHSCKTVVSHVDVAQIFYGGERSDTRRVTRGFRLSHPQKPSVTVPGSRLLGH